MMREIILKSRMVPPDPLLAEYGDALRRLSRFSPQRLSTVSYSIDEAIDAFQRLLRGENDHNREAADRHFDALFARATRSLSGRDIRPVLWSATGTSKVWTIDKPFGVLETRFAQALPFSLIFKEYTRNGEADEQRIMRNAALYKAIYYESDIKSEIFARTRRRLVCTRTGENLAYEHEPEDPRRLIEAIRSECGSLLAFLGKKAELTGNAVPDEYEEKFIKSALLLKPYLPLDAQEHYARAVMADAPMMGLLAHERLVPHIDPTSVNLVMDDGIRFIDLEKSTEMLVTQDHLLAHVIFDPSYRLSFDERCGLGSVTNGGWYYLLRRASRSLEGRMRAPLPQWSARAVERFTVVVENFRKMNEHLGYGSAKLLLELDDAALIRQFAESQMKDHRGS
jgi:hypothetical protein